MRWCVVDTSPSASEQLVAAMEQIQGELCAKEGD
jgi:hypothetical protein